MNPFGVSRLLVVAFIGVSACSHAATLTLPSRITRIEVTDNNMHVIKRIDRQREIAAIVAFVSQHPSGWSHPLAGVPVARLYANFYAGDKFVGHFGVGPGFFETNLTGDPFCSKQATQSEIDAFVALLDMKDAHIE